MRKYLGCVVFLALFSALLVQKAYAAGAVQRSSSLPAPSAGRGFGSSLSPSALAPAPVFWAVIPPGSGARALGFAGTFTAIADDATAASWNPAGLIQLEKPEVSTVYRFTHVTLDNSSSSDQFRVGKDTYQSQGMNYAGGVMPMYLKSLEKNAVFSVNYQEVYDFDQLFTVDYAPRNLDGGSLDREQRFTQEGFIEALTPALAVEIDPHLALGVAFNLYMDSIFPGREIQNKNSSVFRFSQGGETMTGVSEVSSGIDDLKGANITLGALAHLSPKMTTGIALDFPWTADSTETKMTRLETVSSSGQAESTSTVERDAFKIDFPMIASLGLVLHHTPNWYTGFDVGYASWSDYAVVIGGEKFNPLDGTSFGVDPIDDTWSLKAGTEYLCMLQNKDIPLRGGIMWEQRPSRGSPNEYIGFSLGSGIGVEIQDRKLMVDSAYSFRHAAGTRSLLASESALSADAIEHQFYLSGIIHF